MTTLLTRIPIEPVIADTKAHVLRHTDKNPCQDIHIGLLLDHGLNSLTDTNNVKDSQQVTDAAARCAASNLYLKAYERWVLITRPKQGLASSEDISDSRLFSVWKGRVMNRLLLARSETSVLETSVRLHQTYGVPYIPGSMLKGIARAYAVSDEANGAVATDALETLFGMAPRESDDPACHDPGEMGYLIFHDAWWIPGSSPTPLVQEVITPHHGQYYSGKSQSPQDTDSPIPTTQIAVRGAFYFVVEGADGWRDLGLKLLRAALCREGLGDRTHLGYGIFTDYVL
jgi:CRISPR-associated protein Cmr6